MSRVFRICMTLLVIIVLVLTSGYIYLIVKGKDLIVDRLEKQLGKKVSFSSVSVSYPLTIKINQLNVEGYGTAKQASFSLSLPYLLFKQVHFSQIEIIEPNFSINRQKGEKVSWIPFSPPSPSPQAPLEISQRDAPFLTGQVPTPPENPETVAAPQSPEVSVASEKPETPVVSQAPLEAKKEKNLPFDFFARRIIIRNGYFQVAETSENETRITFLVKNVNAEIDRVAFPIKHPLKTEFNFKGTLSGFEGRLSSEQISLSGWADFYKKDMVAKAKLTGMNGQVGLDADLASVRNDMTIKGKMSLDFQAKAVSNSSQAEEKEKNFEDFFIQTLQSSGVNVDLKFQFKTKMDDFSASQISISGEINKDSVK